MGQIKTIFISSLLVFFLQHEFVKGQGTLQIDQNPPDEQIGGPRFRGESSVSKSAALSSEQIAKLKSQPESEIQDDQSLEWRLPREVIPSSYKVKITPIIDPEEEEVLGEQWFVPGQVEITVQAQRSTNNIVLHSKNISIHNVKVRSIIHFCDHLISCFCICKIVKIIVGYSRINRYSGDWSRAREIPRFLQHQPWPGACSGTGLCYHD